MESVSYHVFGVILVNKIWLAKREFYFNHYKEYETTLNSKMQHTVACRGKSN